MSQLRYPSLYQINTRIWLHQLSQELNLSRKATLDDIPDFALDQLADLGFDWVYFLSLWQTGEEGRKRSLSHPEWIKEYQETFPDYQAEDIYGSGFAITSYTLHSDLGNTDTLIRLRDRLHQRGMKLMLDFVPNHTALDHHWVTEHPEYYVSGTTEQLQTQPQNYTQLDLPSSPILAYGRDPYFDGWIDTLQLNYGNPDLQLALVNELLTISQWCDGLRCDMAMLVLPEIFVRTWGISSDSFWQKAIAKVKEQSPDFRFMAEVYWDLEWQLQQVGFDYTYDKRLYDRLRNEDANSIREHFRADLDFQQKSTRFLENHDEPRVAAAFSVASSEDKHKAAALLSFFCPGLRFFHQGQLQGWRQKISAHFGRFPLQSTDLNLQEFYSTLLQVMNQSLFRLGEWQLGQSKPAWNGNWTWNCFIAFSWAFNLQDQNRRAIVVVNYAPHQSQCYLEMPWRDLSNSTNHFKDLIGSESYTYPSETLLAQGLHLDLPPFGYHIFELL
jgi:glycosidase